MEFKHSFVRDTQALDQLITFQASSLSRENDSTEGKEINTVTDNRAQGPSSQSAPPILGFTHESCLVLGKQKQELDPLMTRSRLDQVVPWDCLWGLSLCFFWWRRSGQEEEKCLVVRRRGASSGSPASVSWFDTVRNICPIWGVGTCTRV